MASVNKVILIGHLGRDPETAFTHNGVQVTNFSIATSEKWKDKTTGEAKEKTEWHRLVCFNRTAEVAVKYLRKGSPVYVEGKLQTRSWEKDGQTHYTTEIVVNNLQFLASKNDSGQPPAPSPDDYGPIFDGSKVYGPNDDDDIPF